jgi:hypothetical protein
VTQSAKNVGDVLDDLLRLAERVFGMRRRDILEEPNQSATDTPIEPDELQVVVDDALKAVAVDRTPARVRVRVRVRVRFRVRSCPSGAAPGWRCASVSPARVRVRVGVRVRVRVRVRARVMVRVRVRDTQQDRRAATVACRPMC